MPSAIAVRNVGTIGRADALPAYVPRIFTVINKLLDHLAISILFGPHEDFHLIANLHEIKGIICEVGSYRRTAKKRKTIKGEKDSPKKGNSENRKQKVFRNAKSLNTTRSACGNDSSACAFSRAMMPCFAVRFLR